MSLYKGTKPIAGLSLNTIVSGFNLFDCKWSDHLINDIQWLRSDTFSWQSGTTYSEAYNHLANDIKEKTAITETISGTTISYYLADDGHKICVAAQESNVSKIYESVGIAWYYILDTTNKKFKLPRTKYGFEGLRTKVGNNIEAGLPDPKIDIVYRQDSTSSGVYKDTYGSDGFTGSTYSNTSGVDEYMQTSLDKGVNAPFGAVCTNSIYGKSSTVEINATQMYLYFYVGEFAKNAVEQTAGLNSELLNSKVDSSTLASIIPMIKSFTDGTSGYDIWANGRCRQWGPIPFGATGGWTSGNITFLKKYKNNEYSLLGRGNWSDPGSCDFRVNSMSTTGFNVTVAINTLTAHNGQWETYGILADGEY